MYFGNLSVVDTSYMLYPSYLILLFTLVHLAAKELMAAHDTAAF